MVVLRKRQKRRIVLVLILGAILAGAIWYGYQADQQKIRGGAFGADIKGIQDDLVLLQDAFDSAERTYHEGGMTGQEFLEIAGGHFVQMEALIQRYDGLEPPESFAPSVELFRLSTESQLERDLQIALWIDTGDESHGVRADELHQESFSYELAALASYKGAQAGQKPQASLVTGANTTG